VINAKIKGEHVSDADIAEAMEVAKSRPLVSRGKTPDYQPTKASWLNGEDTHHDPLVYYIRFCCRIKIGTTTNLIERLRVLPHDRVLATEPGDHRLEKLRHSQFSDWCLGGEWFKMAPALISHIRAVRVGNPDVTRRLISTNDAVRYTGRDRQTLYRWAAEGKLTKYPVGTTVRAVKWDILELPAFKPGGEFELPPCDI
jgi:hypothetical protein